MVRIEVWGEGSSLEALRLAVDCKIQRGGEEGRPTDIGERVSRDSEGIWPPSCVKGGEVGHGFAGNALPYGRAGTPKCCPSSGMEVVVPLGSSLCLP